MPATARRGWINFAPQCRLTRFYPIRYRNGLTRALIVLAERDEALNPTEENLRLDPEFIQGWLQKAYIFSQTGRPDDAKQAIKPVLWRSPDLRIEHVPGLWLTNDAAFMKRFLDGLRAAGLPE